MPNGINGSFIILQINGKYLFIKRITDDLWDIPGGGYNLYENNNKDEISHYEVAIRETKEEIGIKCDKKYLHLCAMLIQTLKKSDFEYYGGVIRYGVVYLHYYILYQIPSIRLSEEHTQYALFDYQDIIDNYKNFKSGPLWLFFTFLEYQRTNIIQEGLLSDRRIWQGKEYL